jgi:predicted SAM-dependent methyltransferase
MQGTVELEHSPSETVESIRLNLGAGEPVLPGYVPIDRKNGKEVYPLDYPDNSVEEIYASHILEHFSFMETHKVLAHWLDKLKPGGLLRLAVPNFAWIAQHYLDGEAINTMGYVMGGHTDDSDHHGAIFDSEMLVDMMLRTGFERIGHWESAYDDCSALPVSLNLQGYKPLTTERRPTNTVAILSSPRFGPILHMRCAIAAFGSLGIPYEIGQGAYWQQVLSEQIETTLRNENTEYIITCDYDTAFGREDVLELWRLSKGIGDADAICPMQVQRGTDFILCGLNDGDGKRCSHIKIAELARLVTPITTGHFGLTIFKAAALRKAKRPWFQAKAAEDGTWSTGKIDADINFWNNWRASGLKLYLAHRVLVGHIEETIKWPGHDYKPVYQQFTDYVERGIPAEVKRC